MYYFMICQKWRNKQMIYIQPADDTKYFDYFKSSDPIFFQSDKSDYLHDMICKYLQYDW